MCFPILFQLNLHLDALSTCKNFINYEDDTCLDKCEPGQYIQDIFCISQCQFHNSFIQTASDSHTNPICKEECDNKTYMIYNQQNECISQCNSTEIKNVVTGDILCETGCPNGLVYYNKQCIEKQQCPNFIHSNECVDRCPNFVDGMQSRQCVDSCASGKYATIGSRQICALFCPYNFPVIYQNQCVERCPTANIVDKDFVCTESCPQYRRKLQINQVDHYQCVDSCPQNAMNVDSEQICLPMTNCSSEEYIFGVECVVSCPVYNLGQICVNTCNAPFFLSNKQCVAACPSKFYTIIGAQKYCAEKCNDFYFESNGMLECAGKCPNDASFVQNTTEGYKCVSVCPENHYSLTKVKSIEVKMCQTNCSIDEYQFQLQNQTQIQCFDKCPVGTFKFEVKQQCVQSCAAIFKYLSLNENECVARCDSGSVMQPFNGEMVCQTVCNVNTPFVESAKNKTCVSCSSAENVTKYSVTTDGLLVCAISGFFNFTEFVNKTHQIIQFTDINCTGQYIYNGSCVSGCNGSTNMEYIPINNTNKSQKHCISKTSYFQQVDGSYSYSCSSGCFTYNSNNTTKICSNNCTQYINKYNLRQLMNCATQNQATASDGLCVDSCKQLNQFRNPTNKCQSRENCVYVDFQSQSNEQFCNSSCLYVNQQNECIAEHQCRTYYEINSTTQLCRPCLPSEIVILNKCLSKCPFDEVYYLVESQTCSNLCIGYEITLWNNNKVILCQQYCKLDASKSIYYVNDGRHICIDNCQDNLFVLYQQQNSYTCASDCNDPKLYFNHTNNKCVTECVRYMYPPTGNTSLFYNQCVEGCFKYTYTQGAKSFCTEVCPPETFPSDNVCMPVDYLTQYIVGVALGVVLVLVAIVLIIVFVCKKKKQKKQKDPLLSKLSIRQRMALEGVIVSENTIKSVAPLQKHNNMRVSMLQDLFQNSSLKEIEQKQQQERKKNELLQVQIERMQRQKGFEQDQRIQKAMKKMIEAQQAKARIAEEITEIQSYKSMVESYNSLTMRSKVQ